MTEQEALQLKNIEERLAQCEQINSVLLRANQQLMDYAKGLERDLQLVNRNIKYEVLDKRNSEAVAYPIIKSADEAIEEIVKNKKSLVRFGDGEFATMEGQLRAKFQTEVDEKLAQRLYEVLRNKKENVVTAIADNYGNLDDYTVNSQREIRFYMTPEVRESHMRLLDLDKVYYNAYLSRPYAMYADKDTEKMQLKFSHLQKMWEDRNCVFIEGEKTRMGVGNDLFANARSVKRILAPAENAFRVYDTLLTVAKQCEEDTLFLLALGPAATVLAYDLALEGYQALDIGHLDLEYEWYLQGEGGRTAVPHKYNNEYPEGEQVEEIADDVYEGQIIAKCL